MEYKYAIFTKTTKKFFKQYPNQSKSNISIPTIMIFSTKIIL